MSLTSTKNIEKNKYELEVHIDSETFKRAIEKEYKKMVKDIAIPGFRKGKAPRKMIEKIYGPEVFFEGAVNDCYPKAANDAIEESKLKLVARPEVEVTSVDIEKGIELKLTCYTVPEINVSKYKGIEVDRELKNITSEDVDKELQKTLDQHARITSVEDRPAKLSDDVVIDFEGFLGDAPFEGGKGESHTLSLGSGQFIPGFEEQIVGHSVGEEFDIEVTFPSDYHSEDLSGQTVTFKIKLNEIKGKEYPELDDEFAKDASEFETLSEWKTSIEDTLKKAAEKAADEEVEIKLVNILIDHIEGDIPEVMFEQRVEQLVSEFEQRLQSQGMALDLYLQYTGTDKEAFKESYREQAEKQVKTRLALEKIVELESLEVTEDEINQEYQKFAEAYKAPLEDVKKYIPVDSLKMDLAVGKAVELIKNSAVITEIDLENAEKPVEKKPRKAPAKKTASKKTTTKKTDVEKEDKPKKTTTKKTAEKKSDK